MSSEPTTKAGRSLLGYLASLKVPSAPDWPEHERATIAAIEAEVRTDLEAKVRALPYWGTDSTLPEEDVVKRAAVLRLLTDGAEPPKTGEPR